MSTLIQMIEKRLAEAIKNGEDTTAIQTELSNAQQMEAIYKAKHDAAMSDINNSAISGGFVDFDPYS